jgi:hypothetical protein
MNETMIAYLDFIKRRFPVCFIHFNCDFFDDDQLGVGQSTTHVRRSAGAATDESFSFVMIHFSHKIILFGFSL